MKTASAPALFLAVCIPLALASCGPRAGDECARAAAHLRDCGAAVVSSESCDREAAQQLLDLDCSTVSAAAPGERSLDGAPPLDATAGAVGIAPLSPMPPCTAPAYPALSTTCSDYIDVSGCGGCQFYNC